MKIEFRGLWAPFFLLSTVILLASCGDHNLNSALSRFRKNSSKMAAVETSCKPVDIAEHDKRLKKIDELFTKNFEQISRDKDVKQDLNLSAEPTKAYYPISNPLIISKEIIDQKINQLMVNFNNMGRNIEQASIDHTNELLELRAHVLRMQFNECRKNELKNRIKDDPRAFLFIQDQCQTQECFKSKLNNPQSKNVMKENLEEMCRQIFPKEQCAINIENYSRKKSLDEFLITTKSKYLNEKYAQFYQLRKDSLTRKFSCQKDNLTTKIFLQMMPIGPSKYTLDQLASWIKDKWNNKLINFDIEVLDEKSVIDSSKRLLKIRWVDSPVSFVDWSEPNVINLSNIISDAELSMVIAHEFGHFLGFPDCYIELMNKKSEYIYFELPSQKNIMCSVNSGNVVPEYYHEQIEQKLCQFN